jgi:hypothetical protein
MPPAYFGQTGGFAPGLTSVSCPTESFCVAVGSQNTILVSRSPTGGIGDWRPVDPIAPIGPGKTCAEGEPECFAPKSAFRGVSCPSTEFCAAVTYDDFAYASNDPDAGADAWFSSALPEKQANMHPTSLSCPSPSLCVAVSGGFKAAGRVLTSTDPLSGEWKVAKLGDELDLRGVSCGTPSLCVAVARGGLIFVSTNPTGGPGAWRVVGSPGGPGDLEGVECFLNLLCAAGNLSGNILTSTDPTGPASSWGETDAGGSVQITDIDCPRANRCIAVDNNGSAYTSTRPTGGAGSWTFENLIPFLPTEQQGEPPRNALFGASCASPDICALVGADGHVFTSTEPFSAPDPPPPRSFRKRPRTILLFAEHRWEVIHTWSPRVLFGFRFYSPTQVRGFECRRDQGHYRRCRSPLRYWTGRGHHILRVRAIGPTGLRGAAALQRFRVCRPRPRDGKPPKRPLCLGAKVSHGHNP